ncbi:MAG: hypothetical protein ACI8S6_003401 [Myxococcota bacterium]
MRLIATGMSDFAASDREGTKLGGGAVSGASSLTGALFGILAVLVMRRRGAA